MRHTTARSGFTIVELLIVIIVIAIVAAISVAAYNGIQDRARASAANQVLSDAAKKIQYWQIEQGSTASPSNLSTIGITDTNDIKYQYTPTQNDTYCITATVSGKSYKIDGLTKQAIAGGCPGHGQDGVTAITNLAMNPVAALDSTGWWQRASGEGAPTGTRLSGITGPLSGITTAHRSTLTNTPTSWFRTVYGALSISPGETYTLSVYGRPSVDTSSAALIIWLSTSDTIVSENTGTVTQHTANSWQKRSVTATAPSNAVKARFEFSAIGNGANGVTLDATAVMFTKGNTIYSYADGNSPNWVWNGTPHYSTSTGHPL
jgi:prepilin-type N-terminal cleavage/methylation domain-containing protein